VLSVGGEVVDGGCNVFLREEICMQVRCLCEPSASRLKLSIEMSNCEKFAFSKCNLRTKPTAPLLIVSRSLVVIRVYKYFKQGLYALRGSKI